MTDFTLIAPEPLRFSNSPAESLHHAVDSQLSPGDDEHSYTPLPWSVAGETDEPMWPNDSHSSETSAYTEFQEIIHSSRYAHRDSYQSNLGLISRLVETLREHVPGKPPVKCRAVSGVTDFGLCSERDADLLFLFAVPLFTPPPIRLPASPVPRSHNPLPNNATFATLPTHSKRASSCTPSVLTSSLNPQTFDGPIGYSVGKAF
jgi:hypothetical protein